MQLQENQESAILRRVARELKRDLLPERINEFNHFDNPTFKVVRLVNEGSAVFAQKANVNGFANLGITAVNLLSTSMADVCQWNTEFVVSFHER